MYYILSAVDRHSGHEFTTFMSWMTRIKTSDWSGRGRQTKNNEPITEWFSKISRRPWGQKPLTGNSRTYPLTDGRQDEKKRVRKTSLIAPDKKTRTIKKMNEWNAFVRFSIVLASLFGGGYGIVFRIRLKFGILITWRRDSLEECINKILNQHEHFQYVYKCTYSDILTLYLLESAYTI